jgi:hypothetical protein
MRASPIGSPICGTYNGGMVILNAHFDGRTIVLDEPCSLPLASGTRLKISVEAVPDVPTVTPAPRLFQPLNIRVAPELSIAIASDPEFNVEES